MTRKGCFLLYLLIFAVVVAFAVPVSAFENEFGGYFRIRAFSKNYFNGEDKTTDYSVTDSRTRLYYTARFSEDFKFVNKFEMDTVYGDDGDEPGPGSHESYGGIGADGVVIEVKNSYVDFDLTDTLNVKAGTQGGFKLARGFVFSDDWSGLRFTYKGDNYSVPFAWIKVNEGNISEGQGDENNDYDSDFYTVSPVFDLTGNTSLNPWLGYITQDSEGTDIFALGADLDMKMDALSGWLTGVYLGGDYNNNLDMSAYLFAAGGAMDMGTFSPHVEAFYASGDDNPDDRDQNAFLISNVLDGGQSYYWSEIMGRGLFDTGPKSQNSPHSDLYNIMAGNIGVTVKPMDKLSVSFDLWHASLAEEITFPGGATADTLGTEFDIHAKYKIRPHMNIEAVAAYLSAGDATSLDGKNDKDPYEFGTRFSISF